MIVGWVRQLRIICGGGGVAFCIVSHSLFCNLHELENGKKINLNNLRSRQHCRLSMIFAHFCYLGSLCICVSVCVCASMSAIKCLAFGCFDCNYSPRRVRHLYFHFFVSAVSLHAFVVCSVVVVSFVSGVCPAR